MTGTGAKLSSKLVTAERDAKLLNRLNSLASNGLGIANYGALGDPFGYDRKRVADIIARLERHGKIKIVTVGHNKAIKILATGKLVRLASSKPQFSKAVPAKAAALTNIPPEAQAAMDVLRRARIITYAERVSDTCTTLTGMYVVNRDVVDLDRLLEMAHARMAA